MPRTWGNLNSPLVTANQKRWQEVGQLTRTAALLQSLMQNYPALKMYEEVYATIAIITGEAQHINDEYVAFRMQYRAEQKEQQEKLK